MTLNQLHKRLTKLIEQGYGRRTVCVDKPTFSHACESDGANILGVDGVGVRTVRYMVDDSYELADGTERQRTVVILAGSGGANSKGDLVDNETEATP